MKKTNAINKKDFYIRALLSAGLAAAFLLIMLLFFSSEMDGLINLKRKLFWCGLYAVAVFAVAVYFAFVRKVKEPWMVAVPAFMTGIALAVRMMFFDHASGDYLSFIEDWIRQIRNLPGLLGWVEKIGDYNMPYLYLLTFVAKIGSFDLYFVKSFSIVSDLALAYYLMRLSSFKLKSVKGEIIVFITALFIPTVIYNGSYWGQCDAIYTAFALAFLYYSLSNRPYIACVALGLSIAFKLQAVFIFPMVIILLFARRLKLRHVTVIPATFLLTLLPALLAGRSLANTFSIYLVQASKNEHLTLSAPNVYRFVNNVDFSAFNTAAIMLTGGAVLCLLFFVYKKIDVMDKAMLIRAAFLCVLLIPMLLPQMHERYFFMADCLSILIPVFVNKRLFVPAAVIYSSYRAYASFEMNDPSVNLNLLAVLMILTLAVCTVDFVKDAACGKNNKIGRNEVE